MSALKMIDCAPYQARMSELACAKRHAASYASRHRTSSVRHVGTYALCHGCTEAYESGEAEPNIESLVKLSGALGCSTDWLLGHDQTVASSACVAEGQ